MVLVIDPFDPSPSNGSVFCWNMDNVPSNRALLLFGYASQRGGVMLALLISQLLLCLVHVTQRLDAFDVVGQLVVMKANTSTIRRPAYPIRPNQVF